MDGTIVQHLCGLAGESNQKAVRIPMRAIGDRMGTQSINSAALRIKGGSASATVQTNAAYLAVVTNSLLKIASAVDMPALVGTVVNATFNVFCFYVTKAGVVSVKMGIAGSTLATVVFPSFTEGQAMIGFVQVNPTGTGNFVGGTTVLDDATVVPNAVFANTLGAIDPTIFV